MNIQPTVTSNVHCFSRKPIFGTDRAITCEKRIIQTPD